MGKISAFISSSKIHLKKSKVKYPVTGLRGLEGSRRLGSQISRHSAHEGGKVVTPYAPAAFTPGNILVLIFRG
jgi:hypothetical protein